MHGLLMVAALLSAVSADTVREEFKSDLSDATITVRVNGMLLVNKYLNPMNINVNTRDGVVRLVGSVEDETQKDMAEELAESTRGVKAVHNDLVIVGTTHGEKQRRSFKQKFIDRKITAVVRSRLVANREFKGLKIGVETVNNVVTLHGVVASEIQKTRIGQISGRGEDVKRLINNLTVRPKDAMGFIEGIGRQFSDEWIESRVSTAILLNRHISIRVLDVEVDDGLCILTGIVDSRAQRELAARIADSIRGVQGVQNDVRVRDQAPAIKVMEIEDAASN